MRFRDFSALLSIVTLALVGSLQAGSLHAEEAITLDTGSGQLHGSLLLPEGEGPHPLVILHSGSGPTDRNGDNPMIQGKSSSLQKLAAGLTAAGFATLRYDKRGIGASAAAMKSEAELRFDDYISDAAAWVELCRKDPRLGKVALMGHSEGGLTGPLAASRSRWGEL